MLPHPRTFLIALAGGLIASAAGLSREPPAAAPPAPAAPRRADADGFPLPAGALARFGSTRFAPGGHVYQLSYTPDGRHLAAGTENGVYLWDATTGRLALRVGTAEDFCSLLGFCPAGELVVARYGAWPRPKARLRFGDPKWPLRLEREDPGWGEQRPVLVQRIDVAAGRVLSLVRVPAALPSGVAMSPDGAWVGYMLKDQSGIAVASATTGRERWRQEGGSFYATEGRFSADGRRLWWEARDEEADVLIGFDARTGIPSGNLPTGHRAGSWGWLPAPDGRRVVALGEGLDVWDATLRTRVWSRRGEFQRLAGFIGPDRVVVAGNEGLELWDLKARKRVGVWGVWKDLFLGCVAVAPGGGAVALSEGTTITVFDPRTGRRITGTADQAAVPYLDGFTNRGGVRLRWSDSDSERYTEWNPRTGRTTELPSVPALPESAVASPDHSTYATVSGKVLTMFDARTRRPVRQLVGESALWNPFLHPSGRVFAVGDLLAYRDPATGEPRKWAPLYVWGADGRPRAVIPLPDGVFHSVMPDGATVVTWRDVYSPEGWVKEITRWDTDTGKWLSTARPTGLQSDPVYTPDGRWFLAEYGQRRPAIRKRPAGDFLGLFDGKTGRLVRTLPVGNDAWLSPFRISPDGRTVAVGQRDGALVVIELATGKVWTGFRHEAPFDGVEFSPNGRLLVGLSYDDQMLIWDARGGAAGFPTTPPDGAALAAAWDDLAAEDAREAFVAVRLLAAFPDRAIPFLKQKPPPDGLRAIRVVEAVEWIGTPDAVKLLDGWAAGPADSVLAVEAKTARARLGKR